MEVVTFEGIDIVTANIPLSLRQWGMPRHQGRPSWVATHCHYHYQRDFPINGNMLPSLFSHHYYSLALHTILIKSIVAIHVPSRHPVSLTPVTFTMWEQQISIIKYLFLVIAFKFILL